MTINEYLDLGFIADYCIYYGKQNPFGPNNKELVTPEAQLRREVAPLSMSGRRSLALVSAWERDPSSLCDSLMYANENDLCFQLYAMACHKIKALALPVYSRDDLNITELAILRQFVRLPFAPQILKWEDMDWMLQQHAEALLRDNHNLLLSNDLRSLCAGSSSSDLAVYFNRLISRFCKSSSACVGYFNSLGFSTDELYSLVCKIPYSPYAYKKEVLHNLLQSPNKWSDLQYHECYSLLSTVAPECGISRYSNYKRMYESGIGRSSKLFMLNRFEFRIEEKLSLLNYNEKVSAITRTLVEFPDSIKRIPLSMNGILYSVFSSYNYSLYRAYCEGRSRLLHRAHVSYELRFLREQTNLDPFVSAINEDTIGIFLQKLETKCVINAVFTWCAERKQCYRLKECKTLFTKKQQRTIESQCKALTDNTPAELQRFANRYGLLCEDLTDRQQGILIAALENEGITWRCTLNKFELVYAIGLSESILDSAIASDVLQALMKYGVEYYENVLHYYSELKRCAFDFCPELLFDDQFCTVTPDANTGNLITIKET